MTDADVKETPASPSKLPLWFFIAAIIVGTVLRFSAIGWGLPDRVDIHPDERAYVIKYALKISPESPDPGFLNYPNFIHYSIALGLSALRGVGVETTDALAHAVGRAISATYGSLTILLVWLIAGRCGARRWGQALAAMWVALLPLHIWESHVAVTDVMMTFWIMAVLYGALHIASSGPSVRWRLAVLSGVALGLAVGSKYTAALTGWGVLLAMVYARMPWKRFILFGVVFSVAALLACFVVTPYSFLRFKDLLDAMAFEHEHVRGHHPGFSTTAPGWQYRKYLYQLVAAWPFSFGIVLYASVAAGTIWAAMRMSKPRSILLLMAAIFYGVMGGWSYTPIRYYMPIIVIGALFAGVWHGALLDGRDRVRQLGRALVMLTLGYTACFAYSTNTRYLNDTRIQAAEWLRTYDGPPLHVACLGSGAYAGHFQGGEAVTFKTHAEGHAGRVYRDQSFDILQYSSLHYLRWLRHKRPDMYGAIYRNVREGHTDVTLVRRFESGFLNQGLYGFLDPMFTCLFVSPVLEFYATAEAKTKLDAGLPADSVTP